MTYNPKKWIDSIKKASGRACIVSNKAWHCFKDEVSNVVKNHTWICVKVGAKLTS